MSPEITIRAERPNDVHAIDSIVRRAYAEVAYSDHREHVMIERLRAASAYIPALLLLAEVYGEAAGHILLTKAFIVGPHSSAPTLALAPLSVVPAHQGQGLGKRLVRAAQQRGADPGFGSILLVGIPSYYPRFGFEPLSHYPITLPSDAPEANCMILPLSAHALDGVAGRVQYAQGWLDHWIASGGRHAQAVLSWTVCHRDCLPLGCPCETPHQRAAGPPIGASRCSPGAKPAGQSQQIRRQGQA